MAAMAARLYPAMASPAQQAPEPRQEAASTSPAGPASGEVGKPATAQPEAFGAAPTTRMYDEVPQEVAWFDRPSTEPRKPPPPEEVTMAQRLYGDAVPTNSAVTWDEDAAPDARAYELDRVPDDLRDPDPAAYEAGQAQFREALLASGAGVSLSRELWNDALRAERQPIRTTPAEAAVQLRARFGPQADAKLAAARGLLGKAIERCPEIKVALERTGLGNDVGFIVKLVKRADALARKGAR